MKQLSNLKIEREQSRYSKKNLSQVQCSNFYTVLTFKLQRAVKFL